MKITRSDHEKLVIIDFPYVIGGILGLGALFVLGRFLTLLTPTGVHTKDLITSFIGFSIFFFGCAFLVKRSVFEFDLPRRQLVWTRIGLLARNGATVPMGLITGATVQIRAGRNAQKSYRVALTTTQGDIPLTETYGGGREKVCRAICRKINLVLGFPPLPPPLVQSTPRRSSSTQSN